MPMMRCRTTSRFTSRGRREQRMVQYLVPAVGFAPSSAVGTRHTPHQTDRRPDRPANLPFRHLRPSSDRRCHQHRLSGTQERPLPFNRSRSQSELTVVGDNFIDSQADGDRKVDRVVGPEGMMAPLPIRSPRVRSARFMTAKHTVNGLRIHEISVSAGGAVGSCGATTTRPGRDRSSRSISASGFGFLDDELHAMYPVGDGHQRPRMSSMIAEDRASQTCPRSEASRRGRGSAELTTGSQLRQHARGRRSDQCRPARGSSPESIRLQPPDGARLRCRYAADDE